MRIGFLGVGRMGEPMAANLLKAGHELVIWNRSSPAVARLEAGGATRAATPWEVLREAELSVEMLSNEQVIDEALRVGSDQFAASVARRGFVHMSTTSADYSLRLQQGVQAANGWYVEAPV